MDENKNQNPSNAAVAAATAETKPANEPAQTAGASLNMAPGAPAQPVKEEQKPPDWLSKVVAPGPAAAVSEAAATPTQTTPQAAGQEPAPAAAQTEQPVVAQPQAATEAKPVPVAAQPQPAPAPAPQAQKKSIFDNFKAKFLSNLSTLEKNKQKLAPAAETGAVPQITQKERQELIEAEKIYQEGLASIRDLIAPSSMEIRYDSIRLEGLFAQSFYVYTYPRYIEANWLAPIINFEATMDITQFIYPIDSSKIMRVLKKKVAQMQSSMHIAAEKGHVRDPALETALEDAEQLRTEIQRGQEKFFQFALYVTVYAEDEAKLKKVAKQLESLLGGKLILTKRSQIRAEQAFTSCLPFCLDEVNEVRNMNTSPLSSTFPFISTSLTSDNGILYGINRHNDSLILFDRFSLENANSVVFAKSGAGKSYAVKLELLRLMMLGVDVLVIDPENEYEALSQTVGGSYLKLSLNSDRRINPFDLPPPMPDEDVQPGD
ncbi:DUF87 domain-containing protein, partial [Candidatus Peregrinibacteria bacterium]|nr:DUF87 domain-containing protein [Candidatus Peregrinibacteria bacterium]